MGHTFLGFFEFGFFKLIPIFGIKTPQCEANAIEKQNVFVGTLVCRLRVFLIKFKLRFAKT